MHLPHEKSLLPEAKSSFMIYDSTFVPILLNWYHNHAADLPWRRSRHPYHIWVAEIMLQQTQVTTVIPYYERFLQKFPTIEALATASQDDLMKQWEGLGYYSRARNMQAAARQIMTEFGGELPRQVTDLQKLKGIGRYTAGAIASIAFDAHTPLLDGNVIRVFSRLFDLSDDVSLAATQKKLWQIAEQLMPAVPLGSAGAYNQALMELGREICKTRAPLCSQCPVSSCCHAFAANTQSERPVKKAKSPIPHYEVTCGLIWHANHLLIAKRRDNELLGGLWEFPGGKQEAGESLPECLERELHEELGIRVKVGELFARVQHAYTHFRITLHAFECLYLPEGGAPTCHECAEWRWVYPDELESFAFSSADRQIITELRGRPFRLL